MGPGSLPKVRKGSVGMDAWCEDGGEMVGEGIERGRCRTRVGEGVEALGKS